MSLALATVVPYKNVQFGSPKLAAPFNPVSQFTSSYWRAQFSTEPLSFAEFITACNTAIDNSLYHYCTQCHQFCGSPGFVCNKEVILQLHWRKSVVWFISNSVCSYWNVHYSIKNFELRLSIEFTRLKFNNCLFYSFQTTRLHRCHILVFGFYSILSHVSASTIQRDDVTYG